MVKIVITTLDEGESPSATLAETIEWCLPRVKQSLRTEHLGPRVLEASYRDTVRSVVVTRRRSLGRAQPLASGLAGGRLLAYFPDAELACGSSEAASNGYFDANNAPPWDTWVLLTEQPDRPRQAYETCLIAWVPPPLVSVAQRGIVANPEDSICWLEDCESDLRQVVGNALCL